jgi:hypothetical protein
MNIVCLVRSTSQRSTTLVDQLAISTCLSLLISIAITGASHSSKPELGVLWHSWWLVGYSECTAAVSQAKSECGWLVCANVLGLRWSGLLPSLPQSDATLQQQVTNLVDDCRATHHPAFPHPVRSPERRSAQTIAIVAVVALALRSPPVFALPKKNSSKTAQKSHVKPQNDLNHSNKTRSSWHVRSTQFGILKTVEK